MRTLIRNGRIETDDYVWLSDDAELPANGKFIVSLTRWQQQRESLAMDALCVGVNVPNTVDISTVIDDLRGQPLIALSFPSFADGRAYSQARLLRDRHQYTGEIRATGNAVVLDQLAMLQCCGFTSFALRDDQNPLHCLDALRPIDLAYQPVDTHASLVSTLRRAAAA
ncbi:DUF934 domain-containing protein [Sinimarinibacterium sp. CAU 1509]|uniref:DUF934 domain-containing protein n=1 Tax=Sinimarinibacterium sp. CAU 1509 TaxID=2562283 RepID=UPI0010ACD948|nr:DUF934 domain-containing protein [Sinimarinibacterium sp. CAU 1509]TJY61100.1 DUF934 domain-containing protein [Sinimarinibacterium sp. CAU 1509]